MEFNIWQIIGGLAGAAFLGAIITYLVRQCFSKNHTEAGKENQSKNSIPWRKNVLTLLGIAYLSLFGLFLVMVYSEVDPKEAYNLVGVPFVALIGGTLAVAKDLIE